MAKVVLQLIDDSGDVKDESTLIDGATSQKAEKVFEEVAHHVNPCSAVGLVVEFHYCDGDVGAYDGVAVQSLWSQFTTGHEASHILIRPNTDEGQLLSNRFHSASGLVRP